MLTHIRSVQAGLFSDKRFLCFSTAASESSVSTMSGKLLTWVKYESWLVRAAIQSHLTFRDALCFCNSSRLFERANIHVRGVIRYEERESGRALLRGEPGKIGGGAEGQNRTAYAGLFRAALYR
jgi:hypothetical protein